MKTNPATPHFLRVTQAMALVSGLGFCLVGCGGKLEGGGDPNAMQPVECPPGEVCPGGVTLPPNQPVDASSEEWGCTPCGAESGPGWDSGVETSVAETGVYEGGFPESSFGGDVYLGGGPLDPPELPCAAA